MSFVDIRRNTYPANLTWPSLYNSCCMQVLGVSKKDADVRRQELLGSDKGSLAQAMSHLCQDRAGAWLRQPMTCSLIAEVGSGGAGGTVNVHTCVHARNS